MAGLSMYPSGTLCSSWRPRTVETVEVAMGWEAAEAAATAATAAATAVLAARGAGWVAGAGGDVYEVSGCAVSECAVDGRAVDGCGVYGCGGYGCARSFRELTPDGGARRARRDRRAQQEGTKNRGPRQQTSRRAAASAMATGHTAAVLVSQGFRARELRHPLLAAAKPQRSWADRPHVLVSLHAVNRGD